MVWLSNTTENVAKDHIGNSCIAAADTQMRVMSLNNPTTGGIVMLYIPGRNATFRRRRINVDATS